MEQWQCIRACFFRSKMYLPGEIVTGVSDEIPRHFRALNDGRFGTLGKVQPSNAVPESKIPLEDLMKDSPLLEKAKYMNQMNKAELCAYGRSLGIEFNADDMTRAEMIKACIEVRDKRGTTNQELADVAKR